MLILKNWIQHNALMLHKTSTILKTIKCWKDSTRNKRKNTTDHQLFCIGQTILSPVSTSLFRRMASLWRPQTASRVILPRLLLCTKVRSSTCISDNSISGFQFWYDIDTIFYKILLYPYDINISWMCKIYKHTISIPNISKTVCFIQILGIYKIVSLGLNELILWL